jgi:hypothetical protein
MARQLFEAVSKFPIKIGLGRMRIETLNLCALKPSTCPLRWIIPRWSTVPWDADIS